jgi:hypothetical protein
MADPIEDDDVDGESSPAPAKPSRLERHLSPTAAPTKAVSPGGPTTKWAVDRLDGRERLYGYGSGAMAVVFAVMIYLVQTNNKHLKLAKGQFTPSTTLVVGIACGALLLLTTRIGRRALVGFMAMFTFLAFQGTAIFISLPFLILAVWLLWRSYKVQKAAADTLKADRAAGITPAVRPSRTTAQERAAARRKGPPVPEGNKRYTPKKPTPPPPPAPKPSWRERRAAKTAD